MQLRQLAPSTKDGAPAPLGTTGVSPFFPQKTLEQRVTAEWWSPMTQQGQITSLGCVLMDRNRSTTTRLLAAISGWMPYKPLSSKQSCHILMPGLQPANGMQKDMTASLTNPDCRSAFPMWRQIVTSSTNTSSGFRREIN